MMLPLLPSACALACSCWWRSGCFCRYWSIESPTVWSHCGSAVAVPARGSAITVAAVAVSSPPASKPYSPLRRAPTVLDVLMRQGYSRDLCAARACDLSGAAVARSSVRDDLTLLLFALDFQRDVDELVFLAADEFELAGPLQQRRCGQVVALGLAHGMLGEAGVDPGVAHDQRVAVEQAFGRHGRAHHVFGGIGDLEEVDAGFHADLVEHPDQRL